MRQLLVSALKLFAALAGLPLTLVGFIGFWVGIYMAITETDPSMGVLVAIAGAVAVLVATFFGKFARGDFA